MAAVIAPNTITAGHLNAATIKATQFDTWTYWNNTASTATTMTNAWVNWNTLYVSGIDTYGNQYLRPVGTLQGNWISWNTGFEITQEQREEFLKQQQAMLDAQMAREQEARDREAERRALWEAAQARATELLLSLLSDEQAASWNEHGWFGVRGSHSGKLYRIHKTGISNNVDRLNESETHRERVFCAHPSGLPSPDVWVAQMFLIATDEPEFLRIANSHPVTQRVAQERAHVGQAPWVEHPNLQAVA